MTSRYFAADLPPSGGLVTLAEGELHHALHVMRVKAGQSLTLFDGKGNEAVAEVIEATKRQCVCRAEPAGRVDREPTRSLSVAIALPKPDRAKELVERLTELGAARLVPIVAERTQRPPSSSQIEKLRRAVIEACKQCGRNQLMEITEPVSSSEYFSSSHEGCCVIAHPDGESHRELVDGQEDVVAAIGPEGGWTDQEVQQAMASGFTKVGLGKRIYRIETAAVVIAAMLAD